MWEESLGLLSLPTGPIGLAACMAFWTLMYYISIGISRLVAPKAYSELTAEERVHWNNYAWSTTHGIIGFLGACRSVSGIFPGVPDSHFDSTPLQRFYIQLTLGFFLVDSIHLALDWKIKGSVMMAIHHIIFPLTYGNGLYTISPPFGLYSMAVLQLCEASTPFLHARWFLSKLGRKSSLLYVINGLAFAITFVSVRGFLMTFMFYRIYSTAEDPFQWPGCVSCTITMWGGYAFMALQYIWCVKVVTSALAFLGEGKKPKPE